MSDSSYPIREDQDLELAERIVFRGSPYWLERFSVLELAQGRTPDWRIYEGTTLQGYCEVKSPRDTWLDDEIRNSPPGSIVGGLRPDPTFNRIARHVEKAESQFAAVNQSHEVPNILIIINHDEYSSYNDLRERLGGYFLSVDGTRIPTMPDQAARLRSRLENTDAIFWYNVEDESGGFMLLNELHKDMIFLLRDCFKSHCNGTEGM